MNYNKIALIGMMGCGKTTVAKCLAKKISYSLFEMDEIFEKENSIKIRDFFERFGEEKFRELETEILRKISKNVNFILSCGGGVILKEENRKILFEKDIFTIYLCASSDTIFERIKNNSDRPLLLVQNPKDEIEKIIKQREKYYNLANIKIKTDNKSVEEIVSEILENYGKNINFSK